MLASLILRRSEVTRSHSLRASDLGPSENQATMLAGFSR